MHSLIRNPPPAPSHTRYINDVFVYHIPSASLVRCKHPRSVIGYQVRVSYSLHGLFSTHTYSLIDLSQYQLYGVQDFRRAFQVCFKEMLRLPI